MSDMELHDGPSRKRLRSSADPESSGIPPRFPGRSLNDQGEASFAPSVPVTASSSAAQAGEEQSGVESRSSCKSSSADLIARLRAERPPTRFLNFDTGEPKNVLDMAIALENFGRGYNILGLDFIDLRLLTGIRSPLSRLDKMRFDWSESLNPKVREQYGSTPHGLDVYAIVNVAKRIDCEDDDDDTWNTQVHRKVIELALSSSKHKDTLSLLSIKSAEIGPRALVPHEPLGRTAVDYTIALRPEFSPEISAAWEVVRPLDDTEFKSWNHVIDEHARSLPFAIQIDAKGSTNSWQDRKAQLVLWTMTWFERLRWIWDKNPRLEKEEMRAPGVPLLVVQGHDWYALIFHEDPLIGTRIWQKINIGSTDSVYNTYKIVAALHWLMDWAEQVWRPFFTELVT